MSAKLKQENQLSKKTELNLSEKLRKRNKFKWFGYHLTNLLYYQNPQSSLRKGYENSFHCCDTLSQERGKITSKYCKNRWCPQCQRIRMGALINAYGPRLSEEKDLYFVTLTRPNVKADELKDEINKYQELWRKIQNQKWFKAATKGKLIGIKKLECTYHATRTKLHKRVKWVEEHGKKCKVETFVPTDVPDPWYDTYHPHFHVLVSSYEIAEEILAKWLELNPTSRRKAQDLRKVTGNKGYLEVFKYFTKLIAKDNLGKRYFDAPHMNTIFEAMKGKRVYFRIGRKDVWRCEELTEDDIEEEAALFTDEEEQRFFKWVNAEDFFGYYDVDSGEALTEMRPPQHLKEIFDKAEQ